AAGVPFEALGDPITDPVRLELAQPDVTPDEVRGFVAHVDRFGNLITNVDASSLDALSRDRRVIEIRVADRKISGVAATYSDAALGDLVALIESTGLLEIAVREGSAADLLRVKRGAK